MKHIPLMMRPVSFALLVALSMAGLAGCVSNQSKEESAPAPSGRTAEPAPVAPQAESKPVCKEAPSKAKKGSKSKPQMQVADCVPVTAAAVAEKESPAATAPAPREAHGDSYNLSKNKPITDSTKVESGQGTMVKGINDWEGEISGVPAANSRFARLKIGMSQKQATDLAGAPTDQGAYVTGKAFIPFYFGSDRTRWEMVYKSQGRLIFSNQSGFGSGYYLTWIIHNTNEGGYR